MGSRALAVIHCEPGIAWQGPAAVAFSQGLKRLGIDSLVTRDRQRRDEGFPVLLGTTFWQDIERDGGEFLLVDRCQFGDTNQWVTLGWNGRGREADYKVPGYCDGSRWESCGLSLAPWRSSGFTVLCGQIPPPSGGYAVDHADAFRPHPAGDNPTRLPTASTWAGVGKALVYASSVAVQTVIAGIPTVTLDPRSMAWDVTAHVPHETWTGDRLPWAHRLAWCQWSWTEIAEGRIAHLME